MHVLYLCGKNEFQLSDSLCFFDSFLQNLCTYVSEYKQGTGLENVAEFAYELKSLRV